jgi:hypothetical protein
VDTRLSGGAVAVVVVVVVVGVGGTQATANIATRVAAKTAATSRIFVLPQALLSREP